MSDRPATPHLIPSATIGVARLHTEVLSTAQLQRAWALGYARLVFPTASTDVVRATAAWIAGGSTT